MNTDNLIEHAVTVCSQMPRGGHYMFCEGTQHTRYLLSESEQFVVTDVRWTSYAWPGGYQIHYTTQDGGILCHECANQEFIRTIDPDDTQFHIVAADVHWEGPPLQCDHCDREITSEYGDPDEEEEEEETGEEA